jgi:hypothetical protein
VSAWEAPGATDEWYTPKAVFDALGCDFDMDVAAPMCIPSYIGDRLRCTTPSGGRRWLWKDSLGTEWSGFVWMNPPFGGRNGLVPWLDKFFQHANGIALVPDRTSALWFWDAWLKADAVLFTRKIRFLRPDGTEGRQPSCGTALLAVGPQGVRALNRAADSGFGILATPCPPMRHDTTDHRLHTGGNFLGADQGGGFIHLGSACK